MNSSDKLEQSAWLLELATSRAAPFTGAHSYSISFKGTQDGRSRICRGDGLVAINDGGRIICIGRIYNVRYDLHGPIAYFDRQFVVKDGARVEALRARAPAGVAALYSMSDFQAALELVGFENLESIPQISDHVYARSLLEYTLRDDLLGPAAGPHEQIVDSSIIARYLVGKLAPRGIDLSGSYSAPGGDDLKSDETVASGDGNEDQTVPRIEPNAEFARISGRVETSEDGIDDSEGTSSLSLVPSSIGLTFCVASNVTKLKATISWGSYVRVPSSEHNFTKKVYSKSTGETKKIPLRVWRRIPCGGEINVGLARAQIEPIWPDSKRPGVYIQGAVKITKRREKLVTLFIVNAQSEADEHKDSAWLFQPQIAVAAAKAQKDKNIFLRKPTRFIGSDQEREQLELNYRKRVEFAVGHGVSVHAYTAPNCPTKAYRVMTEFLPGYEVPTSEAPGMQQDDRLVMQDLVAGGKLDMRTLAKMSKGELHQTLSLLIDDYANWIEEQNAMMRNEISEYERAAKQIISNCEITLSRIREGVDTLLNDSLALDAFRYCNEAMAAQRIHSIYSLERRQKKKPVLSELDIQKNRSWYPFQLVFLLHSIPPLANPRHSDRSSSDANCVDLLWFPTGGGKTEAYLGVAAFAMAIRRLQSNVGELDASRGVSVIMRYTLRLLTIQQYQRASTLICAMEMIRREDEQKWGCTPFTIGLWVGNAITPESTTEAKREIAGLAAGPNALWKSKFSQVTNCPWCGSELDPKKAIIFNKILNRTEIFCSNEDCAFSRNSQAVSHLGLPILMVDEEIYRYPPSILIATVDKFAMLAWRAGARNIFGRVSDECKRHGFFWPGQPKPCSGSHPCESKYPEAVGKIPAKMLRPPDLIIQDELHLIGGPLGTMFSLYEAAIDGLCTWHLEDFTIRPKIIASTATVRDAANQVRNVFMRKVSVFPPLGFNVEDNYFAVQRSLQDMPGRRYVGICAPGSARPAVLIRTYTVILTAAQILFDSFGAEIADPYMTLVGYFNALRELGGMKRLADDDVQTRAFRINLGHVERPGLSQRSVRTVLELTSRVSSSRIAKYLEQLEFVFESKYDHERSKWVMTSDPNAKPCDIVLATNMLSVGVDVGRLGVMVVNGQPKNTAEYIQATSRVGRTRNSPGFVVAVLNWSRPRDLSHFETFEHYHATFFKHVEAQSVTPFSPRALDRGLTGVMIATMRHRFDSYLTANAGARKMLNPSCKEIIRTIEMLARRAEMVTNDSEKRKYAVSNLEFIAEDWSVRACKHSSKLHYQEDGKDSVGLLVNPHKFAWTTWTVPMSLREVEEPVKLVLQQDNDRNEQEIPPWRKRSKSVDDSHP